ncbi:MAG: hypothetical protein RL661_80, partial [Pseudomonadota bacterium]
MRPPKYWCQLASAALTCLIVLSTPNGQAAVQAPPGIGLPELDTQSIQAPPPIEESSNSAVSKAAAMMGDSPLTPVPELTNERFSQVDAGGSSVCGILKGSAEIKCWGIDDLGQASPPEGQYKFISMGANHGCALTKAKGLMRCWGAQSAFPHPEQASGRYLSIAAGDDHTCARKLDQTVECWGNNEHGELEVPTGKYRQIVARGDHTCGVTESRGLLCWGDKAFTEYPNNISYPVKRVATGKLHGCVLRGDTMRAECWGNASGGMTNPPPERFIDLVAGDWHTCGVRPNRTAVCWGENEYGQLNIPNKRFKKLSAGGVMTCGILEKSSQTTCAGSFAADSLFFPDDQLAVSKAYQQDGVVRPQLAFMVVFEGIAGLLSSTLINGGKFADKKGKDWESKMIPLQMGILLVNLAMKWIFGGGGVDQTKLLLQDIQKGVDRLESGMKHITQQLANQSYLIQATYCDQQLISYEG